MTTSRRNFLKLFGFTVGVATAGGTIGGTILASPNPEEVTKIDEGDTYGAGQNKIFSQIYGDGGTIEDEINTAITEAQQAPPVEAKYAAEAKTYTDAFIPEIWAQEALVLLEESMVIGSMVHRDFNREIAQYGDVVNTRRPMSFRQCRKCDDDPVIRMDEMAIHNVAIPLKDQFYCKFTIRDGEQCMSYQDLVAVHLAPAMAAIARAIDLSIYENIMAVPGVNTITGRSTIDSCIEARGWLNENHCHMNNRGMVLTTKMDHELCRQGLGGDSQRIVGFNCATDASVPTSIAFHRESIALINRPMPLPLAFCGLRAASEHYNDLSVRVTMSYNVACAGTDVTIDTLCGSTVLEPSHVCRIEPASQLTTEEWMKLYNEDPTKLGLRPREGLTLGWSILDKNLEVIPSE
jgi:hypothetical protein